MDCSAYRSTSREDSTAQPKFLVSEFSPFELGIWLLKLHGVQIGEQQCNAYTVVTVHPPELLRGLRSQIEPGVILDYLSFNAVWVMVAVEVEVEVEVRCRMRVREINIF